MSKSSTNRLGGLIQPKGSAPRPVEIPQRGELSPPPAAPAPVEPVQPAASPAKVGRGKVKSLTVKLTLEKYRRLRAHASRTDLTHQQMMEEAITRYLDEEEPKFT